MRSYVSYLVLIGPDACLWTVMGPYEFSYVLICYYGFEWVLIGFNRSLFVLMNFDGSVRVLIAPFAFSLVHRFPYKSICVIMDSD